MVLSTYDRDGNVILPHVGEKNDESTALSSVGWSGGALAM